MSTPKAIRRLVSRLRGEGDGYTLIELSVAMAGLLVFLSFASPFLFKQIQEAQRTEARTDLQQHARTGMRSLVRELRQARELYQTSQRPSGKNRISFGVDLNGKDGIASNERLSYYIKGSRLYRGGEFDDEKGQPIADDVSQIVFSFFGSNLALDDNGDGVVTETELDQNLDNNWSEAELTQVTRVKIDLTVRAGSDTQTYSENVWLRNRSVG
ncbi:MAG TPA: hypothetical protein VEA19_03390 [Actinomycetota bacterium]|nr:hypothetical protein [Actinomycetota bacterium]